MIKFIPSAGDVIEYHPMTQEVPAGDIQDGWNNSDVDRLSEDGLKYRHNFTPSSRRIVGATNRGFIYVKSSIDLIESASIRPLSSDNQRRIGVEERFAEQVTSSRNCCLLSNHMEASITC